MKKMNRKGFVLAEAIVVAVFVLGMFTYLALNIIPLITKYDQALKYDNPQEVYAANILLDEMISIYKKRVSAQPTLTILNQEHMNLNTEYFNELKKTLNIVGVIKNDTFSSGGDNPFDKICLNLNNRNFNQYCKFLSNKILLNETGFASTPDFEWEGYIYIIQFEKNYFSNFQDLEGRPPEGE